MKLKLKMQMVGIFALSCVLLLGMGGCKKVVAPDAIITISNECGLMIDVFLDGVFQFSVEYKSARSIEELPTATYELEARRTGTGEFVGYELLPVRFNTIFTWHVLSSASLKIMNNYGETLEIYGDEELIGVLDDQIDNTLYNVPYGDRKLEAKTSDETVVAETTISILLDILYEWTINK